MIKGREERGRKEGGNYNLRWKKGKIKRRKGKGRIRRREIR